MGVRRQIAEPALNGFICLVVGLHPKIDLTGLSGVDLDAAEVFEADHLTGRNLEHPR